MTKPQRGFTFVEMLICMIIVGLLSSVAVPKYIDLKRRASTTRVVGDFQVLRVAAISFFGDSAYYPAEAGPGEMPAHLDKYLPNGFTFRRPGWTLDYENWDVGESSFSTTSQVIAITLIPDDPVLAQTTLSVMGGVPAYLEGNTVTFIISGL